ncbi:MAG TPA: nucleotide exchange factor GrpE [Solirubrobacteraceae bacterium]|jgi:molecular chaperone GrpE|nr:nucleotide exchange factor GrpE [Solirubrobacteraceae bacterium]
MPSSPGNDAGGEGARDPSTGVAEPDAPREGHEADGPTAAELTETLAGMEDRYKRAVADLENYRKRSARDFDRRLVEATDAVQRDWLEAVDSVERALRLEPESPLAEGLRAVLEQMDAILTRRGIERVGTVGEPFDPERHEAVGMTDREDVGDHTVLDVARSGFANGDRVLRPAQVIVSRQPRDT